MAMNVSYDFLRNLHKVNPQAYADYQKDVIEEFIQSLPEDRQQHMRQFQWHIDGELRKFKDPVARMNKMCELFWDGFNEFHNSLQSLKGSTNEKDK